MCSELLAYGNALVTRIVRLEVNSNRLRNRSGSVAKRGRPSLGHYAIGPRSLGEVFGLLELGFVERVQVRLLSRDRAVVEQLLERRVHRAHPLARARLHHVLELLELALTDEIRRGR